MGLFKKMRELQAMSGEAMQGDVQAMIAYAQLGSKLAQSGIEARGVVHSVRRSGEMDMGGSGEWVDFDVSIKPRDGDAYQTVIRQSVPRAQLEQLTEGKAITVKYDPDSPTSALIYGW